MKVITHKFREKDNTIKYAVNLVDMSPTDL